MGGHGKDHGHHDHHEPYVVPDYRIYKVEDAPQLVQVQKALASQGLKDPWLRNEVWRFNIENFGTERTRFKAFFSRGFLYGLGLALLTVGLTKAYDAAYPEEHGHGHGHGHGKGHH